MQKAYLYSRNLKDIPTQIRNKSGCVVAIGNFDGVHLGHISVLQTALTLARKAKMPALVLTFEPHPRTFFNPDKPVDRLTPEGAKEEIFRLLGFDGVVALDFTLDLASLNPLNFITQVLIDGLNAKHVVTGENFYFGSKRSGNPQLLKQTGHELGFDVHIVKAHIDESGQPISSSRIRQLLAQGKVEYGGALLGYHYRICAEVIYGNQLGRTLGFPTANMQVPEQTRLETGIYAVRLRRLNGTLHNGVASFGFRPTVNEVPTPLLETFVFNFDANLYGETCCVTFFSRLRGEEKFDTLEGMVAQMHRDTAKAHNFLEQVVPLTQLDESLNFS